MRSWVVNNEFQLTKIQLTEKKSAAEIKYRFFYIGKSGGRAVRSIELNVFAQMTIIIISRHESVNRQK